MDEEQRHRGVIPPVNPYDLLFASHVYGPMSGADASYNNFMVATHHKPDLGKDEHCYELLKWLNRWGCRQFAKDYHTAASATIKDWWKDTQLPPPNRELLDLLSRDFDNIRTAYKSLAELQASQRKSDSGLNTVVEIGPTGAAKILFAIRPKALMPWDSFIRSKLGFDGSAQSYVEFLKEVQTRLNELGGICQRNGIELAQLLHEIAKVANRPIPSLVKLMDEYLWVTITKECQVPRVENLALWATWK